MAVFAMQDFTSRNETLAMDSREVLVGMANADMGVRAIRAQVTSAIDLIVQAARFSDGTRKITYITELVGLEGEQVTMQDIFLFEKSGVAENGKVLGRFKATGVRPRFYEKLRSAGITLPASLFQTIVEIGQS